MNFLRLITLAFLLPLAGFSQWKLDPGHSKLAFIVSHHGISEVDGYFKKFEGKITSSNRIFQMPFSR